MTATPLVGGGMASVRPSFYFHVNHTMYPSFIIYLRNLADEFLDLTEGCDAEIREKEGKETC